MLLIGIFCVLLIVILITTVLLLSQRNGEESDGKLYDLNNFSCPTRLPFTISSQFGNRWGTFHAGVDIVGVELRGSNIYTIADGVVARVIFTDEYNHDGNYVVIRHDDNIYSLYRNLSEVTVSEGQDVNKSTQIARFSDDDSGAFLHVGLYIGEFAKNENAINPALLIYCINQAVKQ